MMKIVVFLFLSVFTNQVRTVVQEQNSPGRPPLPKYANYVMKAGNVESRAISVKSTDFNPALENDGHAGYPGLKIRVNRNAFRYVSFLIAQILDQEIPRARIEPYSQCLPEVNGCAHLSNIMITNYQCPQRVTLFPVPYNCIVLNIENFAISLSGRLSGQITVLLPVPLCGSLCIDARQISVSVRMTVERNPYNGAARFRVMKCDVRIGYLNVYIVNGGLIGDIINSNFRGKIISQARAILPAKVCGMIPSLLDEKVNSQLAALPQTIPIMQMVSYVTSMTAKPQQLPQHCYAEICRRYRTKNIPLTKVLKVKTTLLAGIPNLSGSQQTLVGNETLLTNERFNGTLLDNTPTQSQTGRKSRAHNEMYKKFHMKTRDLRLKESPQIAREVEEVNATHRWYQCAGCDNTEEVVVSHFANIVMNRIRNRASDLALSTYLLGVYATNADFMLSFLGEFSPDARGGTPFAASILHFPTPDSARMLDLLISDYTLNTLLYHLHRKGVFAFRIGPELPSIGDLLNTTCAGDDFDFDLSTEIQDIKDSVKLANPQRRRIKRQDGVEALRNFGVCFGDIAPEIREKNPGKRVFIMVKTTRSPSVQFRAADGGTVVIEFMVDGMIFLDGTATRVGHIRTAAGFAIATQLVGNRIVGTARIEHLKFIDIDKTFGLPQDAFNNLADLARGTITRVVNSRLAQGVTLSAPPLGIPVDLHNIYMHVVEHALFISTDLHIRPAALRLPNRRILRDLFT